MPTTWGLKKEHNGKIGIAWISLYVLYDESLSNLLYIPYVNIRNLSRGMQWQFESEHTHKKCQNEMNICWRQTKLTGAFECSRVQMCSRISCNIWFIDSFIAHTHTHTKWDRKVQTWTGVVERKDQIIHVDLHTWCMTWTILETYHFE